jgi:hypothetical protein
MHPGSMQRMIGIKDWCGFSCADGMSAARSVKTSNPQRGVKLHESHRASSALAGKCPIITCSAYLWWDSENIIKGEDQISLDHRTHLARNSILSTTFLVVAFSLGFFSHASALKVTLSARCYQNRGRHFQFLAGVLPQCVALMHRADDSMQYVAENEHALILSSLASACSVEPGLA